jgi:hypothetical protein
VLGDIFGMPDQVPGNLEVITVINFKDGDNHYLQSWKAQLFFKEGETINFLGDLGISQCRTGKYKVYSDEPANQLNWRSGKKGILRKFYTAERIEK